MFKLVQYGKVFVDYIMVLILMGTFLLAQTCDTTKHNARLLTGSPCPAACGG